MANIQVFEYQNNKVRTVDVDGEARFAQSMWTVKRGSF